jgi:hypothetical protein
MLVYKLCKEYCKDKLDFILSSKLGDGADGEVFELSETDKVIKFGILFEYPDLNLSERYSQIENVLHYIKNNKPLAYAPVYEYKYLGKFVRPVDWSKAGQNYILYYYIMEKLEKISDDEKRVFHSILSHEDKNINKNFTILKIKQMLDGMARALDFDKKKIIFFCEALKQTEINHNDIHVRNIMKDKLGNFKLIDFDRASL